jgi:hypothetical protein
MAFSFTDFLQLVFTVGTYIGDTARRDLAEWSERCATIPKITGSNPSGGSDLTFRSDLLLTARGGST